MRLSDITETCPIYNESYKLYEYLKSDLENILTREYSQPIIDIALEMLEKTDECRNIAGELRDMCVERGEKIQELEEEIKQLTDK